MNSLTIFSFGECATRLFSKGSVTPVSYADALELKMLCLEAIRRHGLEKMLEEMAYMWSVGTNSQDTTMLTFNSFPLEQFLGINNIVQISSALQGVINGCLIASS